METQKPAKGILLQADFSDSKHFRVPCECGCESEISFSIDVDDYVITGHFYSTTKTNNWRARWEAKYFDDHFILYAIKEFANNWYNRLAVCWGALVHGKVTTESYTLMSRQQVLNFSQTLLDTVEEFDKRQDKIHESANS